jgi:hypothetical protein
VIEAMDEQVWERFQKAPMGVYSGWWKSLGR